MNRRSFIKMLELTGKMVPVPRHTEFSNEFLKDVLSEIPRHK